MKVTSVMVSVYILFCIRIATRPCKYFQLNASFFDREAGIFSKAGINELIPAQWRLAQWYDDGARMPEGYPVFVKPEWSQNARGVHRADNADELRRTCEQIKSMGVKCLIQEAAMEANEYEIFSIPHHHDPKRYAVFTITQTCNDFEPNPVNGIYNPNTRYIEITDSFSAAQLAQVWRLMRRIGSFKIARVSVRANSIDDLLQGKFHVIEVNLFLPMPINLLDTRYANKDIFSLVMRYMKSLALATKYRDKTIETKPVFIASMLYNRRNALLNFVHARL